MKPVSRRVFGLSAIVLLVVLFAAVNIASNIWLRTARVDLTETGLYTLSPGTAATLTKLQEPVRLRFFFSRKSATGFQAIGTYAARVRDLLQEYSARANGKIILEEIDPEPFTPAEDDAVAAGMTGAPIHDSKSAYFGLAGSNTLDGHEVIPFFDPAREIYLEYDLTTLIYKLGNPKKPTLGLLSTLPLETGPGGVMAAIQGNAQPYAIYQQLRENFDVQTVDANADSIPANMAALSIVHPVNLPAHVLYAIDQFVLRGGHAIVFVDPNSEIAGSLRQENGQGGGDQGPGPASNLPELFRAWGVAYDAGKIVADGDLAQRVRIGNPSASQAVDYIVWLKLTAQNVAAGDPVTSNLQQLNIATSGALKPVAGATTHFTPLLTSSSDAALLNATEVRVILNPADLLRRFEPAGGSFTLAARLSGPAKTAFPQGAPALTSDPGSPPAKPAGLPAPIASAKNINVVVVADTDLLDDRFWVNSQNVLGQRVLTPTADNGAFVINIVENMLGSSDLISLRTRASADRPFTRVAELQRDAEARFLSEERQLQDKVNQTQASLRALETGGQGAQAAGAGMLTAAQQATVDKFRKELIETRASLRDVQANLRRDVQNLGAVLTFLNIALVPLLVAATALVIAVIRRRRRMQARGI